MISDTARFHGAFFVLLFERIGHEVTVKRLNEYGAGFYLLAGQIPVYLKMSTKRRGPWTFNFFRSHQEVVSKLFSEYQQCFVCLLCGNDGVAGMDMWELRQVLDGTFEEQECVSVYRPLKTMYKIKGRDGVLEGRISRGSIFEKLAVAISKGTVT